MDLVSLTKILPFASSVSVSVKVKDLTVSEDQSISDGRLIASSCVLPLRGSLRRFLEYATMSECEDGHDRKHATLGVFRQPYDTIRCTAYYRRSCKELGPFVFSRRTLNVQRMKVTGPAIEASWRPILMDVVNSSYHAMADEPEVTAGTERK